MKDQNEEYGMYDDDIDDIDDTDDPEDNEDDAPEEGNNKSTRERIMDRRNIWHLSLEGKISSVKTLYTTIFGAFIIYVVLFFVGASSARELAGAVIKPEGFVLAHFTSKFTDIYFGIAAVMFFAEGLYRGLSECADWGFFDSDDIFELEGLLDVFETAWIGRHLVLLFGAILSIAFSIIFRGYVNFLLSLIINVVVILVGAFAGSLLALIVGKIIEKIHGKDLEL